jgi:hypothetical protein
VQYYEKGERDGKSIDIPKTVRLACFALTKGATDYDGPDDGKAKRKSKSDDGKRHKDKAKHKDKHKGGGKSKKHRAKAQGAEIAPKAEPDAKKAKKVA